MFMILCVIDDPRKATNVMKAWRLEGIPGTRKYWVSPC